nr:zinc knuckle CX2CX4HX4C [Tanacetum cinerariifolium]GEY68280.1 zinc knuckle CX2CX4HX4C [Tanacetum cinerariifolium]
MDSHGNLREGTATRVTLEEPRDIMKNYKGAIKGLQCDTSTRAHSNPSYGFGDSAIACNGAGMQQNKASNSDPSITSMNGDVITELFGVSLSTPKDIDTFTSDLESGKYPCGRNLLEKSAKSKSTFYDGAAGARAKELLKVNSNFRPLVVDPVFDEVNIFIPRKVIKKSSFARCLIEVNSEADLVDVVTVCIPSLNGEGFTKEIICVEYEWRPSRIPQDNQDRDLVLKRKKEISLDYNNSFLDEYECSFLALDREERRDEEEEIGSFKTRSNNVNDQEIQ